MSGISYRVCLLAVVVLGCLGPAAASDIEDMQWFAPRDLSFFGSAPRANEGFFFAYEGLVWAIPKPGRAAIGLEGATRLVYLSETIQAVETNTMTNSFIKGDTTGGHRFDLGFMTRHSGWYFSAFRLNPETTRHTAHGVSIVFNDPPFGPSPPRYHLQGPIDTLLTRIENLPVRFDTVNFKNRVEVQNFELSYVYRLHPNHWGGFFEVLAGARYLEFDEQIWVVAQGGTLDETSWKHTSENHIIGPQLGGRWFRKFGNWTWSTEGRFLFGFNRQNFHQNGFFGFNLTPDTLVQYQISNMGPSYFASSAFEDEFSPVIETRIGASYQITRAISARVGWTGIWVDNIARATTSINYEVPRMGIDLSRNADGYAFIHGVTFGLDINR